VASIFSAAYQVPKRIVAETQALCKKTKLIRGASGLRRNLFIKTIARQKQQLTNKLTDMDPPVQPAVTFGQLPPLWCQCNILLG
jgi:hypothetical protein